MNYNKLMSFCWIFIFGVVIGAVFLVDTRFVPTLYTMSGILFAAGVILFIINKNISSIPSIIITAVFLVSAFILGFTRYTDDKNITSPYHIKRFAAVGWDSPEYKITAKIISEPEVYYDKTRITIDPLLLITNDGKKIKNPGGYLMIQIKKKIGFGPVKNENPDWEKFSTTEVYGHEIEFSGRITEPMHRSNPGCYSWKEYLESLNIYGLVYSPKGLIDNGLNNEGWYNHPLNWGLRNLTVFSLNVKNKMLWIFRQTMPFPQSAFLGGVTLGLRRGIETLPCFLNSYYDKFNESVFKDNPNILKTFARNYDPDKESCNNLIADEFRWSGTSHVLAVSGLHVSIITIFLYAVFGILRIPKKIFAPLLVFSLIVFTIITGSRPSTVRAAIMNSIAVLTFVYSKRGLKASVLFAIASAGFIILLHNPLIVFSASLTLSFGAVISLVLLTGPVDRQLMKLKGMPFVWFLIVILLVTILAVHKWFLFTNYLFYIPFGLFCIGILILLRKTDRDYPVFGNFGYHSIPRNLRQFFAAQFGIQFGMMLPLASVYFGRFPIAGSYANFIAIPLIGIIVQLGMLAGLLGMLPGIGLWIALCLNATNWLLCTFFLYIAHLSTVIFNYPQVTNWEISRLLLYYFCLGVFIWWDSISRYGKELFLRLNIPIFGPESRKYKIAGIIIVIAALLIAIHLTTHKPVSRVKTTILAMRYGTANVIQIPNGKTILMNGGLLSQPDLYNPFKRFDSGLKTVFAYLKKQGIIKIDALILTSLKDEYITGLLNIVRYADIKVYYDQFDPKKMAAIFDNDDIKEKTRERKFFEALGNSYFLENRDKWWIKKYYTNYKTIISIIYKRGIPHKQAYKNRIVTEVSEEVDGQKLRLMFLNPKRKGTNPGSLEDNSVVTRFDYGKRSIIFGGAVQERGIRNLSRIGRKFARADILFLPDHGVQLIPGFMSKGTSRRDENIEKIKRMNTSLLKTVRPKVLLANYSYAKDVFGMKAKRLDKAWTALLPLYKGSKKRRFYNTEEDLAIMIYFDNKGKVSIETMKNILDRERAEEKKKYKKSKILDKDKRTYDSGNLESNAY